MMRVANHLKTVGCCLKRLDHLTESRTALKLADNI